MCGIMPMPFNLRFYHCYWWSLFFFCTPLPTNSKNKTKIANWGSISTLRKCCSNVSRDVINILIATNASSGTNTFEIDGNAIARVLECIQRKRWDVTSNAKHPPKILSCWVIINFDIRAIPLQQTRARIRFKMKFQKCKIDSSLWMEKLIQRQRSCLAFNTEL